MNKDQQIKNTLYYLAPPVVGNLLPFITLPIFTRILTPVDYGILALARTYAIVASSIANFGLAAAFERNYFQYKDPKDQSVLMISVLSFVAVLSMVIIGGTYFIREFLSRVIIGNSVHYDVLFWSLCAYCLVELKQFYLFYFRNAERVKEYVYFVIVESIGITVLSLIFVAGFRMGVMGLVWGHFLSVLLNVFVLTLRFVRRNTIGIQGVMLFENLKLSYPLIPRILVKTVGTQFDKYMIGLLSTIGGAGIYGIGQKISGLVLGFLDAFSGVFRPQVYKKMFNDPVEGGKKIGEYLTPFFYVTTLFTFLLILFCEEVISFLTPPSYHGAINITILLAMFYLPMFFQTQPQLLYAKKTFLITLLSSFGILLNIALNIPFIKSWGAQGAAWATFISGMITSIISFAFYQKYYPIHWQYKKIGPIFVLFLLTGLLLISMREIHMDYAVRFVVKLGFLVSFLYCGLKINVLTRENIVSVKNIILKRFFA